MNTHGLNCVLSITEQADWKWTTPLGTRMHADHVDVSESLDWQLALCRVLCNGQSHTPNEVGRYNETGSELSVWPLKTFGPLRGTMAAFLSALESGHCMDPRGSVWQA